MVELNRRNDFNLRVERNATRVPHPRVRQNDKYYVAAKIRSERTGCNKEKGRTEMAKEKRKLNYLLLKIYLFLVVVSLSFTWIMVTYYTDQAEFSGLYIGLLTLPWSLIAFSVLNYLKGAAHIAKWVEIMTIIMCVIPNALFLYYVGRGSKSVGRVERS
jgi:hypothetical protein